MTTAKRLTRPQVSALVSVCARAGINEAAAQLIGEELVGHGLLTPENVVTHTGGDALTVPETAERFAARVWVSTARDHNNRLRMHSWGAVTTAHLFSVPSVKPGR